MFIKKKDTSPAAHRSFAGLLQAVDSLVIDLWTQTYRRVYYIFLLITHCTCSFLFLGSALVTGSTGLAV